MIPRTPPPSKASRRAPLGCLVAGDDVRSCKVGDVEVESVWHPLSLMLRWALHVASAREDISVIAERRESNGVSFTSVPGLGASIWASVDPSVMSVGGNLGVDENDNISGTEHMVGLTNGQRPRKAMVGSVRIIGGRKGRLESRKAV